MKKKEELFKIRLSFLIDCVKNYMSDVMVDDSKLKSVINKSLEDILFMSKLADESQLK